MPDAARPAAAADATLSDDSVPGRPAAEPAQVWALAAAPLSSTLEAPAIPLRAGAPASDDLVPEPTRPAARAVPMQVPVVMYHYISDVPPSEAGSPGPRDLRVPPSLFAQHLEYLKTAGYHTVTAPTLWSALKGQTALPERAILLTFDDGYEDAYTNALPLLQRYGFVGTFFITVNLVGRAGYVSWDQVAKLSAAGMDVESHAMDHISMAKQVGTPLLNQFATSRRILSERTGTDVRFFAYPNGEYSDAAIAAAKAAGYDAAFLKSGGALQSPEWGYALRRFRVPGYTGAPGLKALLTAFLGPSY